MSRGLLLASLIAPNLLIAIPCPAEIIYINTQSTGENSGQSWRDAYSDLQSALGRAVAGDELWIAQGTYCPTIGSDREQTFVVQNGIGLYGGFSGNENNRAERLIEEQATILEGNIGDPALHEDNSERIITAIDVDVTTVLDGLIIQNAFNDFGDGEEQGGGIYGLRASFRLENCTIRVNRAGGGGGLWNEEGSPQIVNCTFSDNYSSGITHLGGSPKIVGCRFVDNEANGRGGAYNASTAFHSAEFLNCVFIGNESGGRGGAYYGVGHPTFDSCMFIQNVTLQPFATQLSAQC